MCEIISASTSRHSASEHELYANQVYDSMGDSLGMLALSDAGETFEYDVFRSVSPDAEEIAAFVEDVHERADLLIHHGRLATQGAVTEEHSHPLHIDCAECDVDYIIHNGVMWGHQYTRENLERMGHTFSTNVDSEVIAHSHREVPTTFGEDGTGVAQFRQQPGYILANEDALYLTTGGAYYLTKHGEMAKQYRGIIPDDSELYGEVILTPSEK